MEVGGCGPGAEVVLLVNAVEAAGDGGKVPQNVIPKPRGLWGCFGWLGTLLEFSGVEELMSWR